MKKLISAVFLALTAFSATADVIHSSIESTGTLNINSFEFTPVSTGVQITPFSPFNISVGGYSVTYDGILGPEDWIAYCVEIFSPALVGSANSYSFGPAAVDATTTAISKLFTVNGGVSGGDRHKSAGIQLAIWELLYDTSPSSVSTGNFMAVTGASDVAATNYADFLLAGIASAQADYTVFLFGDNSDGKSGNQDLITAQFSPGCNEGDCGGTVPEPASLALASIGLLGARFAIRRRKTN